jgi:hypothetical protein
VTANAQCCFDAVVRVAHAGKRLKVAVADGPFADRCHVRAFRRPQHAVAAFLEGAARHVEPRFRRGGRQHPEQHRMRDIGVAHG